jgi:hypothetical protein
MLYIIIGLIVVLLITLYIIRNLLKKNEKQEDILIEYLNYLDKISKIIIISDKKLKQLDYLGSFESDDETGIIFKSILEIQDILNSFQLKNITVNED